MCSNANNRQSWHHAIAVQQNEERTRVKPLKTLLSFFSGLSFVVPARSIAFEWKLCGIRTHTLSALSLSLSCALTMNEMRSRLGHNAECIEWWIWKKLKKFQKVNKHSLAFNTRFGNYLFMCRGAFDETIFCRFFRGRHIWPQNRNKMEQDLLFSLSARFSVWLQSIRRLSTDKINNEKFDFLVRSLFSPNYIWINEK